MALPGPLRYGSATMAHDPDLTHFGYETVPLAAKQGRVDAVFRSVAGRYDLMNDLMSAGMHRLWKSTLVSMARPPRTRPYAHLDMAGGTGDVGFRIAEAGGDRARVTVADINPDMLAVGRERAEACGIERVTFREADATALPFPDRSFDGYTIAFGIRNVPEISKGLREARRVLRPGSRFLCLEFSHVYVPGLDRIYEAYSFNVIPRIGELVAKDRDSYQYLVESIRRFPRPAAFASMIEEAGFRRVSHRPLSGGIVAIHSGWAL